MELNEKEAKAVLGIMKLKNNSLHETSKYSKTKKTPLHNIFLKYIFENITTIPSPETRESIACMLSVSPRNIQIWFQNRKRKQLSSSSSFDSSDKTNISDENSKYKNVSDVVLIDTYLSLMGDCRQI
ncbi:Homeobox protein HD-4 [Cucumispora dikerogammari]|nr:Homeobox protein HD-4 [Cucumispora dikerogammari]